MTQPKFLMPAEWQPHDRTILAMPGIHSDNYWPPGNYNRICSDVTRIAQAIARFENVVLYVAHDQADQVKRELAASGDQIELRVVGQDDIKPWMRDIAPTFVISRDLHTHGIDFSFNGWGGKDHSKSNRALAAKILMDLQIPTCKTNLIAEGGAIETDGEGTLLATESSLINPNRNPGLDKAAIELELTRLLSVTKVVWLAGVSGADTTDCHVDALARFARPGVVILSRPSTSRNRVWMTAYRQARQTLENTIDATGRTIQVVDLHEPDIRLIHDGHLEMIPSYLNYLHVAGAIIFPQFGVPEADAEASNILRQLFPDKELCPVELLGLPNAGGGIHCVTQQIPEVLATYNSSLD